jgi:hypothetical protein
MEREKSASTKCRKAATTGLTASGAGTMATKSTKASVRGRTGLDSRTLESGVNESGRTDEDVSAIFVNGNHHFMSAKIIRS